MRTVGEINTELLAIAQELGALATQTRAAESRQRALWDERVKAEAATEFLQLPEETRLEFQTKHEHEVAVAQAEAAAAELEAAEAESKDPTPVER